MYHNRLTLTLGYSAQFPSSSLVLCLAMQCMLVSADAIVDYGKEFFSAGLRALKEGGAVESSYKFFMPNMVCMYVCMSCDRHVTRL